jgi:SsrA-binding protein
MAKDSDSKTPAADGGRKGDRVVATNRKALHEYFIDERFESGIVLTGTEVKSLRQGKASLAEAYAAPEGSDIFIHSLHISPYDPGNRFNHDPIRKRKLLLHRREIRRLQAFVQRRGYTLIPLKLYFQRGYAKVSLGLARGKKSHDKRHAIAERDAKREVQRALRTRQRDRP